VVKPLFKKLDLLIIKAFIGPFIATFFITLFVLVLQFFWLYIDDIVGKGVDLLTVARLITYVSATLVPLALPLAVLLSSIMTFGNLGETFELIAIKSAGISILRFMRPIGLVSLLICYIAFLFNNSIIPVANLKMNTLKYDIIMSKPAFDIKEGVFYDKIEGYVIKIGKKEKDDSTIRNVVIYEQNNSGLQDDIIVAEKGKMIVTPDKRSLAFILQNGWTYRETGSHQTTNTEFVRMGFSEYKKVLDLSSFKMNKTEDSAFKNNYQMLAMNQLGRNIDSLEKLNKSYVQRVSTALNTNLKFVRYLDTTGWADIEKMNPVLPVKGDSPALYSKYLVRGPRPQPATAQPMPSGLAQTPPSAATQTVAPRSPAVQALVKRADSIRLANIRKDSIKMAAIRKAELLKLAATRKKDSLKLAAILKRDSVRLAKTNPKKLDSLRLAANLARIAAHHPNNKDTGKPAIQPNTATNPAAAPPIAAVKPDTARLAQLRRDSALAKAEAAKPKPITFYDLLPDSVKTTVLDRAITNINSIKINLDQPSYLYEGEQNDLRLHQIAWHEKLTLSVACLVMFLIGAPLGSIIRKGGIGMPLVIAVVFFVIFFLLNNFGKKFVKQDVLTPVGGMWMATYVLTPIGLFLVYKALHDSQLFNKEFYFRMIKKVRHLLQRKKVGTPTL
jgi:lipopolysaccharide export system permease protein